MLLIDVVMLDINVASPDEKFTGAGSTPCSGFVSVFPT